MFLATTTILHFTCLFRTLLALEKHDTSKSNGFPGQEFPWSTSGQVALNFSNDFSPITSENEWASFKPKVFQLTSHSDQAYMISMHQQLYCLDAIRVAYLSYHLPRPKLASALYDDAEICLEQLRQQIMCTADLTLEPTMFVKGPNGTSVPGTSGLGVLHRCKNWKELEATVYNSNA
ncbi:hypothetical protein GALMADRAFT_209837 [Galerina marginata CBS 339.88]|uniref:Uncharacterized protein n=1 Tax=Galerina marginata (strain CBS 339.88) TaxID=685588 RepID=A0A067TEW7_GALM3|nr:hypothetical protein GALMADRAFT_209837 [Galerina marginata CBS 339.88]